MTTRNELIQDIDTWLARDDLSSGGNEATFLRIAQAQIDRRVRLRSQEVTTQIAATTRITALPADFLALRSISLDSLLDRHIDYLPPERIREAPIWQNQGGFRNERDQVPTAYTIEGNNLILAPEPTAENPITLDIVYFSKLSRLVNPTDTNELLTNHYDVYLWAVLMAAGIFLEDEVLEAKYERRFEKSITELIRNERRGRFSGSAMISTGNPRRVV